MPRFLKFRHLFSLSPGFLFTTTLPVMVGFYGLQRSLASKESRQVLWLPLLVFLVLTVFSTLTLRSFRDAA